MPFEFTCIRFSVTRRQDPSDPGEVWAEWAETRAVCQAPGCGAGAEAAHGGPASGLSNVFAFERLSFCNIFPCYCNIFLVCQMVCGLVWFVKFMVWFGLSNSSGLSNVFVFERLSLQYISMLLQYIFLFPCNMPTSLAILRYWCVCKGTNFHT